MIDRGSESRGATKGRRTTQARGRSTRSTSYGKAVIHVAHLYDSGFIDRRTANTTARVPTSRWLFSTLMILQKIPFAGLPRSYVSYVHVNLLRSLTLK